MRAAPNTKEKNVPGYTDPDALVAGKVKPELVVVSFRERWQATIHDRYDTLEPVWRKLEDEGHCTAFQTYDWAASWYDTAISCGAAKPIIITVSGREADPVWILPLCLYRRKGLRIISFADLGVTDYTAPVITRGAPSDRKTIEAMIKAVLDVLPPCDAICLEKITEKVEGVSNPLLYLPGIERFPVDCHGIRFSEPWSVLQKKIMPSRIRSNIRRRTRLIGQEGKLAFEHQTSPETLPLLMDKLVTMRNERFTAIGKPAMPLMWQKFYQALSSRQERTINIGITTMTVAGNPIALSFGLVRGDTFHGLLSAFEMGQWQRFSPGILLCNALLTDFSEQVNGKGYFDFSVGDEPYKKYFGSESYPLYEWVAPRSFAGWAFYLLWRAKIILRRYPRLSKILKGRSPS